MTRELDAGCWKLDAGCSSASASAGLWPRGAKVRPAARRVDGRRLFLTWVSLRTQFRDDLI